jgi:hypothetical protein
VTDHRRDKQQTGPYSEIETQEEDARQIIANDFHCIPIYLLTNQRFHITYYFKVNTFSRKDQVYNSRIFSFVLGIVTKVIF